MAPKFHNKDGSLTAYAFACGYIQSEPVGPMMDDGHAFEAPAQIHRYTVRLSATGGTGYDVKVSDARLHLGLAAWESFDTLTAARRAYRRAVKHYTDRPVDAPARHYAEENYACPWGVPEHATDTYEL